MPESIGADAPQSRTLQSLERFTPEGVTALAAVGLVLLDAINKGELDINPPKSEDTWRMLVALELLQDELHGDSRNLQQALAEFVAAAEGASHG